MGIKKNITKLLSRAIKTIYPFNEYATKLAGMNREQVNEGLRVLAKIEDKPELQKISQPNIQKYSFFRKSKGINAIKPIVAIATKETAAFWA